MGNADHALSTFLSHLQLQGLSPVSSKLAELVQQHAALAMAVDATRHEMPVQGVLPVDEGIIAVATQLSMHTS